MNWVGLFVHLNGYLYFYYAAFLTITSGAMYVSKYGALVFGRSTPPGGDFPMIPPSWQRHPAFTWAGGCPTTG